MKQLLHAYWMLITSPVRILFQNNTAHYEETIQDIAVHLDGAEPLPTSKSEESHTA